jgi:hypothetical protein
MKTSSFAGLTLAFAGMSLAATSGTATTTGAPKPSPTQDGLIDTCNNFYKAVKGDTCIGLVRRFAGAFTQEQFVKWNPAVGDDCLGLWADTFYCVGVPDGPTTLSTSTTATSTATPGNGIPTPTPTQPGMVDNCNLFYFVKSGDRCRDIAATYKISQKSLFTWNPAIKSDCTGLQAFTNVCVNVIGSEEPLHSICNTATETNPWGENKAAALEAATAWCKSDAVGVYNVGQKKTGCFNAPVGENKFIFEVANFGTRGGITPSRCSELLQFPIDQCDRGGLGRKFGWQSE